MQRSVFHGFGKTLLTIIGIVLLIIFGTRAASQASSLAAVGGSGAKKGSMPITGINGLVATLDTGADGQSLLSPSQPTAENGIEGSGTKTHNSKPGAAGKAVSTIKKDVQNIATDTGSRSAKRLHVK